MRVTESITLNAATLAETRTAQRFTALSQSSAAGLAVGAPSDDPVAWEAASRLDARVSTLTDRSRIATRSAGDLDQAESALAAAGDLFVRARQIAVQMSNGSVDATTRANAAQEVNNLRDQLVALANTKGATGYLFGGSHTDTPPFDAAGVFSGNDDVHRIEVADGVTATANASGARAFTVTGGTDLFTALGALSTALTSDSVPGIQTAINTMETGRTQLVAARVDAGLSAERLRSAADVSDTALTNATAAHAKEVDIDPVKAYSDLQATQFAYSRSVDVTRQILSLATLARV